MTDDPSAAVCLLHPAPPLLAVSKAAEEEQ